MMSTIRPFVTLAGVYTWKGQGQQCHCLLDELWSCWEVWLVLWYPSAPAVFETEWSSTFLSFLHFFHNEDIKHSMCLLLLDVVMCVLVSDEWNGCSVRSDNGTAAHIFRAIGRVMWRCQQKNCSQIFSVAFTSSPLKENALCWTVKWCEHDISSAVIQVIFCPVYMKVDHVSGDFTVLYHHLTHVHVNDIL